MSDLKTQTQADSPASGLSAAPLNTVQQPEPRIEYCACDYPLVPTCTECGEYSHDVIRRGDEYELRPLDHSDCQEGLGWTAARDCSRCEGLDETEGIARWRDQRWGIGNW
jgi:hypothetical protein